jgi:23S rRNA (adenine2503-C2)-methyltransferase
MIDLYGTPESALGDWLHQHGEPRYRTKQIRAWLFDRGATTPAEMTDLPRKLRDLLTEHATIGTLDVAAEQQSKDGTTKRLYRLPDGQLIESVLMPYDDDRRTACISSQAGCAMGCVFCATGQMGFARHLTEAEIFEQAARFAAMLTREGERLSNVVMMGMGEPFHNYDAAVGAMRRLMRDLGIGARHITVSTVGLVPKIRQFADEGLQCKLAISLHAVTDDERSALLPVNRRYPLAELVDACREYQAKTHRRISFEWALIQGKTDLPETAHALGRLVRGLDCHVNLIPLNPTARYDGAPTHDASEFIDILARYNVPATVRVRRGIDIDAGCGQLKSAVLRRSP